MSRDRRGTLQTLRGHAQWRGACVSWCVPYLHSDSLRLRDTGGSLLLFAPLPCAPFGILARTSPRCIVEPLERSQPIGPAHDDFIMKKRNARVDRTPFSREGRERHRGTGTVSLRVPKCLPSLLNARWTWKGEDGFERRVERFKDRAMVLKPGEIYVQSCIPLFLRYVLFKTLC